LWVLSRRRLFLRQIIRTNAADFVPIFYCEISSLCSDHAFISFKRRIKELRNVVMVLLVLTDRDPIQAVKATMKRSAYLLIPLSVVLIKYYPDLAKGYDQWTGVA
jgi:exopolysaccharide production protein ExoQ